MRASACSSVLAAMAVSRPSLPPTLRMCDDASATAHRWFNPLLEFGPVKEPRPPPETLPVLLVLPGLDGSGVTAWTQYPELALSFDVRALAMGPSDRSTWDEYISMVARKAASVDPQREVFILGESMGSGVALQLGQSAPASVKGIVLVSPATSWSETWLGKTRQWLVTLPDGLLLAVITLTSYQLLDAEQFTTTLRRIVTGERSPLLDTPERLDYAWRVVKELPTRLSAPAATVRWRIREWAEPSMAVARAPELERLQTPMLIVAGTADMRVPAASEARRLQAESPTPTAVHFVRGAGHAGATDDRVNLREVIDQWRARIV